MEAGRLNALKDISKCTRATYINWHEVDQPGFEQVPGNHDVSRYRVSSNAHGQPDLEPEIADIILGSELTYVEKNVAPLMRVVKKYLKPNGVFYHVVSDDRTVRHAQRMSPTPRSPGIDRFTSGSVFLFEKDGRGWMGMPREARAPAHH